MSHKIAIALLCGAVGLFVPAARASQNPPVFLNEWLVNNVNGLVDQTGLHVSWLELYNAGNTVVDLGGLYLTDSLDQPTQWQFPVGIGLAPGGFLFLSASENTQGLHANLSLSTNGDTIALFDRDGTTLIDSIQFGPQEPDVSQGRYPDGSSTVRKMFQPTPGDKNFTQDLDFLPLVILQSPRGGSVPEGAAFTFDVLVNGGDNWSYQWVKSGAALPGANGPSLTFDPVEMENAGEYAVLVQRGTESLLSNPAYLQVLTISNTVEILEPPRSQLLPLTSTQAVFYVNATGPSPLTYQWRLNGVLLPWATNKTLVRNKLTVEAGGRYDVIVGSGRDEVLSESATLEFDLPLLEGSDTFSQVPELTLSMIRGRNTNASRESGEPMPGGKWGGRSVWYAWTAPTTGIVTFDTRGSTFDTLLGVYAGDSFADLQTIAEDDDRGPYYTSEVRFNAVRGATYRIVVDGHGGVEGTYVLHQSMPSASGPLPVITEQPSNVRVARGSNAVFSVQVEGTNLIYQWYFLQDPILGATQSVWQVPNVQSRDLGTYYVRVRNGAGVLVNSLGASLEIGHPQILRCVDKFHDLMSLDNANAKANGFARALAAGGSGGMLPLATNSVTEVNITTGGSSMAEPMYCGVPKIDTWHELPPVAEDTYVTVEAFAEKERPSLAIIEGITLSQIACVAAMDTPIPWEQRNIICYQARAGETYYLVVNSGTAQRIRFELRVGLLLSIDQFPQPLLLPDILVYWCAQPGAYRLEWTNALPLVPNPDWPPYPGVINVYDAIHTTLMPAMIGQRYFRLKRARP